VGGNLSPSAVTTPGAYGRAILERTGLVPPLSRPGFLDHGPRILGTMESYHGGEVILLDRGEPVEASVYVDVASQFVQAAIHLGAWRFLTAKRIGVEDLVPTELERQIDELRPSALTDPRTYRRFGLVFANLVSAGTSLPQRVPGGGGSYTSRVGAFTCPEPTLYSALDLIRARFEDGGTPQIDSAFRLVPRGRVRGLDPFTLPGAGSFDPNGADLFRWLFEVRVRVRSGEVEVPAPWSRTDLATTLKAAAVALIGSFAQIIPSPERSRSVEVQVTDGRGSTRTVRTRRPESPGDWYCPPLAVAILAASRLQGFALRHLVEAEGGRSLYSATDSLVATALSREATCRILAAFEHLNPTGLHGPRVTASSDGLRVYFEHRDGPLALRIVPETLSEEVFTDEQGERYVLAVPLTFTGWHTMRYTLVDQSGRPVVCSEHGLGDLVDADLERLPSEWISRALAFAAGLGPEPEGLDRPRLVVQAANRPGLSEAVTDKPGRLLRAWSPLVLAFERNELGIGERMLAAPWGPGFDPVRVRWHIFGLGEPAGRGTELQTIRDYLVRYTHTRERGTLDAAGRPSTAGTVGPLCPRPTVALSLRRVGREAHDVGEWRPGGPRRPVAYETGRVGPGSRSVTDQAFRDACRILRRALSDGKRVHAQDGQGKALPADVLAAAVRRRTAPPELRRALIEEAARLAHAPAGAPEHLSMALSICDFPGCSSPAVEGGRWCGSKHRKAAYRARLVRARARELSRHAG